jgi:hypothetical protein
MAPSSKTENERIADEIQNRSPAGPSDIVRGWQNLLGDLLVKTAPYMQPGRLVTFQKLRDDEKRMFEKLHRIISIPGGVSSIYLPPSVRYGMMYQRPDGETQPLPDHSPDRPPDMGVLLACRKEHLGLIVNGLLARPPFAPAVDVYDDGRLLAGYVYHSIEECIAEFSSVLGNHFQSEK